MHHFKDEICAAPLVTFKLRLSNSFVLCQKVIFQFGEGGALTDELVRDKMPQFAFFTENIFGFTFKLYIKDSHILTSILFFVEKGIFLIRSTAIASPLWWLNINICEGLGHTTPPER